MKKIFMLLAGAAFTANANAQDTYESANLMGKDLNGTARYVGMGGAMEALGADISTISTNPAGIGLIRRSVVSGSFGVVSQQDAVSFEGADKTKLSFDQGGFVYSFRSGRRSYMNFAFNYHKSKNFNFILSASDKLNGASQNKVSYLKGEAGVYSVKENDNGEWIGVDGNNQSSDAFSQLDYLYYNALIMDKDANANYYNASGYNFGRSNSGYIGEYDINLSGNSNDRVYWGFTFGIKDVHYNEFGKYSEALLNDKGESIGNVAINDSRKITGTGFDIKGGLIFRPFEFSPFRVGLYVQTPTWYDLTTSNHTSIDNGTPVNDRLSGNIGEKYDFKLYSPWTFGVSLGHTIGNYFAIGATYEFSDYGSSDVRINDGGYYTYDGYYESSSSDREMNKDIDRTLKAVSTFKIGMEFKPMPNWAVRMGYNYVSPMYNENGFKDGTINSPGTYYSSTSDYTNWKATNRITVGCGYNVQKWSFDLAYVYSQTNGDFYPFMNYYVDNSIDKDLENVANAVKVSNKRNQIIFTLSYKL